MSTNAKPTPRARIQVRRGTYRNQPGFHILGKTADGSSVRIFSSDTTGAEARRMAGEIRAGKQPRFDQTLARSASQEQCDACVELDRYMADPRHACFCTSEQSARKSMRNSAVASARDEAIEQAMAMMQEIADTLRKTATALRMWQGGTDERNGGIHPMHAANRLEKIAERISASGKELTPRARVKGKAVHDA